MRASVTVPLLLAPLLIAAPAASNGAPVDGSLGSESPSMDRVNRAAMSRSGHGEAKWVKRRYYQKAEGVPTLTACLSDLQIKPANHAPPLFVHGKTKASGAFHPDAESSCADWVGTGELVRAGDEAADGRRVGINWRADRKFGICFNTAGYRFTRNTRFLCDIPNIPESTRMHFRVGRCNGSRKKIHCRNSKDWRWGPWKSYWDDANTDGPYRQGVGR